VVVALLASFPYAITWTQHNIPAIVHMTHNSQEQGTALADILFGDDNPGGKLVQTWPRSMEQLPPMMDYDIRNGRTYQYFKGTPLYPFGYGLSYTTFTLSDFKTSADILKENGVITVNVQIKNTGKLKGDEVVQLYIQHLNSVVTRPQKELKAFKRVTLLPGEQKNLQLQLTADQLRYWNETSHSFVLEKDKVKLMVGTSSADIKFQKVLSVIK
jgi:beta-glucosidase